MLRDIEYIDDESWELLFEQAQYYDEGEMDIEVDEKQAENEGIKQCYSTPEEALKDIFGYDSFKLGQKEVIDSILLERDTFAVMPTGAGKSICYQIPALLLPGVTLVISPLISLMQDQVKSLLESDIPAAFINSSLTEAEYIETLNRAKQGDYKIIYVAPERLVTDGFRDFASSMNISMITVDEAHCISQWGQDFRPSYVKIVEFVNGLIKRPIISAFTATATENVREDIVCALGLINPFTLVTGFDRENLFFQVDKPKNKEQYIFDYLDKHPEDSGIIYCATRKAVDSLYDELSSQGISVAKYHAGMSNELRKKMQDDFVYDYTSVVVATNAFGMGIDKSNVRFVIHYNMPQSMENYYQEAGRAGRDGLDAKCILLFSPQDIIINRFLLDHKEMMGIDPIDMETIRERDLKRLQAMESYCYTTECLRNYILNYFGERPTRPCEDCGNCLKEFETVDMTEEAKQIVNCVFETKGRFGKTVVIDTVVGAKTARLEEIGATRYKSYGALTGKNKNLIKRLFTQMLMDGYIQEIGEYHVIGLGDITELKKPETKVLVKITDEDKRPERNSKISKNRVVAELTSQTMKLFDNLREVRREIAREEGMPPYIIFSDKALIDMCLKLPTSREQMLKVSGVGKAKYEKYGMIFLNAIDRFLDENPDLRPSAKTSVAKDDLIDKRESRKKSSRAEFYITAEEAAQFKYSNLYFISDISDELKRIGNKPQMYKPSAKLLTQYLISEGLIEEKIIDGVERKIQTERGRQLGIETVVRENPKIGRYTLLKYPKEVQGMIVEHFTVKDENSEVNCWDSAANSKKTQGKAKKKKYADWAEEYPDAVVVRKEGAFFTVRGENAVVVGNISNLNVSSGNNPVSGSPKLEGITDSLVANEIDYIVVINDEITEEGHYENNHYHDYID